MCKIRGRAGQFFVMLVPTGQVIFSVSIDINYLEQKIAKETFKHFRFRTNLCSVNIREMHMSDPKLILH